MGCGGKNRGPDLGRVDHLVERLAPQHALPVVALLRRPHLPSVVPHVRLARRQPPIPASVIGVGRDRAVQVCVVQLVGRRNGGLAQHVLHHDPAVRAKVLALLRVH